MPSLLMVTQPTTAGVGQCVHDWSVGLRSLGWEVTLACPAGPSPLRDGSSGLAVRTWQSVRTPWSHIMRESRDLRRIISTVSPDVVMLHSSKAGLVGRMAIRGAQPTIFVPHAWSFDALSGPLKWLATRWERLAARWTALIICVSEDERQRGQHARIVAPMTVARNGVDQQRLLSWVGPDRHHLRAELGIEAGARVAVCVGRLSEQKGQDLLLRAWQLLPDTAPRQRGLYLAGDGPAEAELRQVARTVPYVIFLGAVDRKRAVQWLGAADVAVVPSRWEGMALVPIEALAVGTPVVAYDVTGMREVITPTVGALVAPGDAAALAAELGRLLATPDFERNVMAAAAKSRVAAEFSLERTVALVDAALRPMVPLPAQ